MLGRPNCSSSNYLRKHILCMSRIQPSCDFPSCRLLYLAESRTHIKENLASENCIHRSFVFTRASFPCLNLISWLVKISVLITVGWQQSVQDSCADHCLCWHRDVSVVFCSCRSTLRRVDPDVWSFLSALGLSGRSGRHGRSCLALAPKSPRCLIVSGRRGQVFGECMDGRFHTQVKNSGADNAAGLFLQPPLLNLLMALINVAYIVQLLGHLCQIDLGFHGGVQILLLEQSAHKAKQPFTLHPQSFTLQNTSTGL